MNNNSSRQYVLCGQAKQEKCGFLQEKKEKNTKYINGKHIRISIFPEHVSASSTFVYLPLLDVHKMRKKRSYLVRFLYVRRKRNIIKKDNNSREAYLLGVLGHLQSEPQRHFAIFIPPLL